MPVFGDELDAFEVGAVRVTVRYGCIRRDQYELTVDGPLPAALRDRLAALGTMKGTAILYVIEVPEAYQLTVAPAAGRAVMMPRLSIDRSTQRAHALSVADTFREAWIEARASRVS